MTTMERKALRAGLETAAWISVDDTGARHAGANGTCTQIGNDHLTWFATTGSKSRLNFLDLLRTGHDDYVVNDAALDYMRARNLAGPVIARLAGHPERRFADAAAWTAHLRHLGIDGLRIAPDPVRIATEGALWGSVDKAEPLAVLDRPDIPLNTNGSENDIRCQVMRRKVSAGTRAETGRACRDAFLGLMKTCRKLEVSFWHFLGDRLDVPDAPPIPPLPNLIRARAAPI